MFPRSGEVPRGIHTKSQYNTVNNVHVNGKDVTLTLYVRRRFTQNRKQPSWCALLPSFESLHLAAVANAKPDRDTLTLPLQASWLHTVHQNTHPKHITKFSKTASSIEIGIKELHSHFFDNYRLRNASVSLTCCPLVFPFALVQIPQLCDTAPASPRPKLAGYPYHTRPLHCRFGPSTSRELLVPAGLVVRLMREQ